MTKALADQALRYGPLLVLFAACLWLMFATRWTSIAIGRKAYSFGGCIRQRAAQALFRAAVGGALLGSAGYATGLDWGVLNPVLDEASFLRLAGLAMACAGAMLTAFAQSNMGRRWRVGIPDTAPDALVTTGLFGFSRNPVFLGVLTLAVGLAAALPSPVLIASAAAFCLACEIQVRDEERFLRGAFGPQYATYRTKVRRWV